MNALLTPPPPAREESAPTPVTPAGRHDIAQNADAASAGPHHADIAIFTANLNLGGIVRVILNLCEGFLKAGLRVDLLVCDAGGEMASQVPNGVRLIELSRSSNLLGRYLTLRADPQRLPVLLPTVLLPLKSVSRIRYIGSMVRYLKHNRPPVVISTCEGTNLATIWAQRLAKTNTRLIASIHRSIPEHVRQRLTAGNSGIWRWRYLPGLLRHYYAQVNCIVAVSEGVAKELEDFCGLPATDTQIIHNPVVNPRLHELAQQHLDDPWVSMSSTPLILAAGRLNPQKDFATLLHAVKKLLTTRQVRLAILGEGESRDEIAQLVRQLGISEAVHMPGYVDNPFAYMKAADVFALSSKYEGLPTVIIEAMACGCPVVSTDCPSGPSEILADGRFGELVPVGDSASLARAIERSLDSPVDQQQLTQRASDFGIERSTAGYLQVIAGPSSVS